MPKSLIALLSLFTGLSLHANVEINDFTANQDYKANKTFVTPTVYLPQKDWPAISDDLDLYNMQLSIHRQMQKFLRLRYNSKIKLGNTTYSSKVIPASLLAFQEHMNEAKDCLTSTAEKAACYQELEKNLKKDFNFWRPRDQKPDKGSLFTGYYTPTIPASLTKTGEFQFGIYEKPEEESLWKSTRKEIDFQGKLADTKYETFFTNDLYENYLLHIEGGGRLAIQMPNGETRYQYLTYDGTNKQSFRFIYKYMQSKGYIESPSIKSQKAFLDANPDKWEEIYSYCPSYVYFKSSEHPPLGNEGTSLVNGRSIATDRHLYRLKGLLAFVTNPKPVRYDENGNVIKEVSSRFFVDHDTGGAIRGSARADLFYGEDDLAVFQASYTYDRGSMYFMTLKTDKVQTWYKIFDKLRNRY